MSDCRSANSIAVVSGDLPVHTANTRDVDSLWGGARQSYFGRDHASSRLVLVSNCIRRSSEAGMQEKSGAEERCRSQRRRLYDA